MNEYIFYYHIGKKGARDAVGRKTVKVVAGETAIKALDSFLAKVKVEANDEKKDYEFIQLDDIKKI